MVSRLVLVRHAKTQERTPELIDKERQLTCAGRRSIEARFPVALQLLSDIDTGEVRVWSSPATRALQTAEVVARVLDIGGIEVKDSLYLADVDAFMAELAAETGTVVAVGHNPFMEELYDRLSGTTQDLGCGAIASFALEFSDENASEAGAWLEWFVQAPRVAFWQTVADLEGACAKAGKRITRCAAELMENPDDPESLHQYRISLRIARSLLAFLEPYCKEGALRKTADELKELQDPTSRIRELDMLLEALGPQEPEAPAVRETCVAMREIFIQWMGEKKVQKAIERVARRVAHVPWRKTVERFGLAADELADRVGKMRTDYEVHMAQVNYDDQEAVHDVRKQAKALRYVTREFAACLPDNAGSTSVRAEAVQDKLGELCDCWNNAQLIVEVCGPEAVSTASRFVVRANQIIADLKTSRMYGLTISDS